MFPKFCAVAALLPFAAATITFSIPSGVTSGGPLNITWTSSPSDPSVFSIELSNPALFRNALAIANNVPTSNGAIVINLPIVEAADDYTLEAVDPSNINSVFGNSTAFSIGATVTSTSSSASSTAALSAASGSSSAVSGSASATAPVSAASTHTTHFVTGSSSSAVASASAASNSASSTNSASGSSTTPFNGNGASGVKANLLSAGSIAAAALAVVAGAVGFAA
ncbi:hypothetical protein OF83DRAFT_1090341 [Amylostereum chailletii]|nr:hypothetical protein OF83DRAFT_1090341 [Amylostereum chailletii]